MIFTVSLFPRPLRTEAVALTRGNGRADPRPPPPPPPQGGQAQGGRRGLRRTGPPRRRRRRALGAAGAGVGETLCVRKRACGGPLAKVLPLRPHPPGRDASESATRTAWRSGGAPRARAAVPPRPLVRASRRAGLPPLSRCYESIRSRPRSPRRCRPLDMECRPAQLFRFGPRRRGSGRRGCPVGWSVVLGPGQVTCCLSTATVLAS